MRTPLSGSWVKVVLAVACIGSGGVQAADRSVAGQDYPEGRVSPGEPRSRPWTTPPEYAPYVEELRQRPEYRAAIDRAPRQSR